MDERRQERMNYLDLADQLSQNPDKTTISGLVKRVDSIFLTPMDVIAFVRYCNDKIAQERNANSNVNFNDNPLSSIDTQLNSSTFSNRYFEFCEEFKKQYPSAKYDARHLFDPMKYFETSMSLRAWSMMNAKQMDNKASETSDISIESKEESEKLDDQFTREMDSFLRKIDAEKANNVPDYFRLIHEIEHYSGNEGLTNVMLRLDSYFSNPQDVESFSILCKFKSVNDGNFAERYSNFCKAFQADNAPARDSYYAGHESQFFEIMMALRKLKFADVEPQIQANRKEIFDNDVNFKSKSTLESVPTFFKQRLNKDIPKHSRIQPIAAISAMASKVATVVASQQVQEDQLRKSFDKARNWLISNLTKEERTGNMQYHEALLAVKPMSDIYVKYTELEEEIDPKNEDLDGYPRYDDITL